MLLPRSSACLISAGLTGCGSFIGERSRRARPPCGLPFRLDGASADCALLAMSPPFADRGQSARRPLQAWPPRRSRQSSAASGTDRGADVELGLQLRDLCVDLFLPLGAPLLVQPLPRRLLRLTLRILQRGDLAFDVLQRPADDR